ncbi:hypothetical protein [uncultured Megasphaera sp.]|nr:hypothetical protein [uncultured Megasphaera sp.]
MTLSMGLWMLILLFIHDLLYDLVNKSEIQFTYIIIIAILLAVLALL